MICRCEEGVLHRPDVLRDARRSNLPACEGIAYSPGMLRDWAGKNTGPRNDTPHFVKALRSALPPLTNQNISSMIGMVWNPMQPIPLFLTVSTRPPRLCPGLCPIRSAGNAKKVTLIPPASFPPLSRSNLSPKGIPQGQPTGGYGIELPNVFNCIKPFFSTSPGGGIV